MEEIMSSRPPRTHRVSSVDSFPPPLLPIRSPLRPTPRSISSSDTSLDSPQTPTDDLHMRDSISLESLSSSKALPDRPDSPPLSLDLEDIDAESTTTTTTMSKRHHAMHELLSSERAYASDLALIREVHIPLALGKSCMPLGVTYDNNSSVLGQTAPIHNVPLPITPPKSATSSSSGSNSSNNSAGSSRTVSTVSTDSDPSFSSVLPMSPEDAKVIFSNISELAMLSDMLSEDLELALGAIVDGGQGDDFVGALFIKIIPDLERPYKHYITRHPTALAHLQSLPQTPALLSYLAYTQSVASSVSHAWDLASLLIKPVQRLLKYPLLLTTILDETPDGHPDKENLRQAREGIEELARNVNEGRRRAEVVKDVLTSSSSASSKSGGRKSTPGVGVGVAASVNLSKVKSLRHGGVKEATMRVAQLTEGTNSEAAQVDAMQAELRRLEVFAQQWAKNVVDWGKMMANVMLALRTWALSFGKVIGLSAEQRSEAFDAFLELVQKGLMPLTADLEAAINERLLKDMAHLLTTMNLPLKLLASMNEQEPYHYHLLTMPVSQKNRPPPSLLAASTNYLALRGQLAAELPTYLALMHRGFAIFVRRLAAIQTHFWHDVKEHWAALWEMLRVEGELNAGWQETCAVWCARWADVDEVVKALGVMHPPVQVKATLQRDQRMERESLARQDQMQHFAYPGFYMPMALPVSLPPQPQPPPPPRDKEERKKERKQSNASSKHSGSNAASTVQSMFAALEPAHSPVHRRGSNASGPPSASASATSFAVSAPLPLGSVPYTKDKEKERTRGRGASDASTLASSRGAPRPSLEGSDQPHSSRLPPLTTPPATASAPARRRTQGPGLAEDYAEWQAQAGQHQHQRQLGIARMKSMPLSPPPRSEERLFYQPPEEEYQQETVRQRGRERDRTQQQTAAAAANNNTKSHTQQQQPRAPSRTKPSSSPKPKSKERPTHTRNRSGSVKSFFTSSQSTLSPSHSSSSPNVPADPQPLTPSQRDSWVSKPSKYTCQVIHACKPPASVSYYSFPFFTLIEGALYEVLQEAGHPSIHPKLPLYVDDGEDCLLLCRDGAGVVGWALASFLEPLGS